MSRLLGRSVATLAAVYLFASIAVTSDAAIAGTYLVRQCDYASAIFGHALDWSHQGHPSVVQHPGSSCTEFGLAARTTSPGLIETYQSGTFGGYTAIAPPDTVFRSFTGSFGTWTECCIDGLVARAEATQFADGSGFRDEIFSGDLGASSWQPAEGTMGPVPQAWMAPSAALGARRIAYGLFCTASSCDQSVTGFQAIRGRSFAFEVDDLVAPSINQIGGTLAGGGWHRGERTLVVHATDAGGGLRTFDAQIAGGAFAREATTSCAEVSSTFTDLQPCPLTSQPSWSIDTTEIPDGEHTLEIAATDVGGADSRQTIQIKVDNIAPAAPTDLNLEGPAGWRSTPEFTLRVEGPTDYEHAPPTTAHYEVCRVDTSAECEWGDQPFDSLGELAFSMSETGQYRVRVGLEDAAGNFESGWLSDAVELWFDDEVPDTAHVEVHGEWFGKGDAAAPLLLGLEGDADAPVSGIAGYSVTSDGTIPDIVPEWTASQPHLSLGDLNEGATTFTVRSVSGAGIAANAVAHVVVRVDRTSPVVEARLTAGDGWSKEPVVVDLTAEDQADLSGMAPSPAGEPVEDGGYVEYSVDDGPVRRERGAEARVSVAEDGRHLVTFKAVDVAGNSSVEKAVQLEVDRTPPSGGFELQDPADPRRLTAFVWDGTSGVAGGRIEYRKRGAGAFRALRTTLAEGRLTALVDDLALGRGRYDFRAIVWDRAGNQASIGARVDGRPMVLALPVRLATRVEARLALRGRPCRSRAGRKGRGRQQRRTPSRRCARRTRPARVLRYGRRVGSRGRLTTAQGAPIAGTAVLIEARPRGRKAFAPLGTARTGADGRFRFALPGGPSRILRYRFAGGAALQPAMAQLRTRVRAVATLKVDRRRLRNGQAVRFRGRLRGRPLPAAGKLVALQARVGREWRTFATPRANPRGAFRHRYRFTATTGLRRYSFRALVTRESAYPYERGRSRTVRVTVRGR